VAQRFKRCDNWLVFIDGFSQAPKGTSEQLAEKVFPPAKGDPQALKHKPAFSDSARPRSYPSLLHARAAFFAACEAVPYPKPMKNPPKTLMPSKPGS